MAAGLGCTPEEWADLKSKIDDSFWVMRIIGQFNLPASLRNVFWQLISV